MAKIIKSKDPIRVSNTQFTQYGPSTLPQNPARIGAMGAGTNFTVESLTDQFITATRNTLGSRVSEAELEQIRTQFNTDLRIKYGIEAKPPDPNWVPIEDAAKSLGIDNRSVRRIVQKIDAPTQYRPQLVQQADKAYVHLPTLINYREQFGRTGRPKQNQEFQDFSWETKKQIVRKGLTIRSFSAILVNS